MRYSYPQAILLLVIVLSGLSCSRPPQLSEGHDVNAFVNDSLWFGTGKGIRLVPVGAVPASVRQFNLQFITDIDFPGNGSASRSPKITGCVEECVPTQRLHIYNIPLRKGKYRLSKLDKRRTVEIEKTTFWLLINGGGQTKNCQYQGRKPAWVRVTRYDKKANMVEGRFSFTLDVNPNVRNDSQDTSALAQFREGQFRVKLMEVGLKQ
jgi:hypothetical protein